MDYYVLFRWYHILGENAEDFTEVLGVFDNFEVAWEFATLYCQLHRCSIDDIDVGHETKSKTLREVFNED